ncbi:17284_t:CDS:2, partial [Racocetra persica]
RNRLEFANGSSISHLIFTLGSNINGRVSNSPLSIKEKHTFSRMDSRYKLEPGQRALHTNTQSIQVNMHLNVRYKDPRNLKELLTEFKIENGEFENWINTIP